MRNVSGGSCRENQNTHFMFNSFFFPGKTVQFMTGIILRMRNISGESCRENQNTHFYVQ